MAHEVESMMYAGATPWHGLGVKVDGALTTAEAMVQAGLDWTVETVQLQTVDGESVPEARAVRRSTDRKVLGVVGPDYMPLQNAEALRFFDPFIAAGATIETAGSLRGGARVWALAKLNTCPIQVVPGDTIEKYLLLSNAHDGTQSGRCGLTPIRVVCANTLAQAHMRDGLARVRHTKNIVASLDAARDRLLAADQAFEAQGELFRRLAAKSITSADLTTYVRAVFAAPAKPDEDDAATVSRLLGSVRPAETNEATARRLLGEKPRVEAAIQRLVEEGRGNQMPGVRGTLWGAYNAVTEYVSYERGGDRAKRLDQTWFGSGATLAKRALDVGLQMA